MCCNCCCYGELKNKTISMQRAKLETYDMLVAQKLPVPSDLKYEIESQGLRVPEKQD